MHIVDWCIIGTYLLVAFGIGSYRTEFIKNIRDYAVGKHDFRSFALFATISTVLIGANTTLGLAAQTYAVGIVFLLTYFGCSTQQLLVTIFVVPRLRERFKQAISVGDIMYILYGKQGQVISGICALCFSIGIMSAQVAGIGYIFNFFLDISHSLGCVLGCGLVVLYSAFGGIKGVVNTNIFQLIILGITMFMITTIGIQEVGGFTYLMKTVPLEHWNVFAAMSPVTFISLFIVRVLGTMLVPAYLQRILIAHSTKDYVRGSFCASMFFIPIFILSALVGLVALVLYPDIQPSIAMPYLIKNTLPPVLIGFAVAGLLAVIMSTTDSWLHSASISLVHDIIQPLQSSIMSQEEELKLAKVATLVLGFSTLGFCLTILEIPSIVFYAFNFWAPVILIPLLMGIFGKTIPLKGFYMCMFVGVFSSVLWNALWAKDTQIEGMLIGLLANFLVFMFFNYRSKKRLEWVKPISMDRTLQARIYKGKLDPISN